MQLSHDEAVADLWTAQFFHPLTSFDDPIVCTTDRFLDFASRAGKLPEKLVPAQVTAAQRRFFHWHSEFAEVFEHGGFDVVLGNPPWDMLQLDPQELLCYQSTPNCKCPHICS